MGLYLGTSKRKINLNGNKFNINLYSSNIVANSAMLKTVDGVTLKDSNGLYLTIKESD